MSDIQSTIEEAFERRADITPRSVETHVKEATLEAIDMLGRNTEKPRRMNTRGVFIMVDEAGCFSHSCRQPL